MCGYRRYYITNSIVFITCVTNRRYPYLMHEENLELFMTTVKAVQRIHPFDILAYVLLPDHFHWLIQLPEDQSNFSRFMQSVKWNYTYNYKHHHNIDERLTLWQRGFYDHVIRDDKDFKFHLDYIHWNPVKHNLVVTPNKWRYSSLKTWVEKGLYPEDACNRGYIDELIKYNFE